MIRPIPVYHALNKKYGGDWTYNRKTKTWIDLKDDTRFAHYVTSMSENDNFEPARLCMYFTDGRSPEWVSL